MSRGIQSFINLYEYATAFGLMYGDARLWILLSVIVLIPYIFVSSLDIVVFVGKWFQITDDDLLYLVCRSRGGPDSNGSISSSNIIADDSVTSS